MAPAVSQRLTDILRRLEEQTEARRGQYRQGFDRFANRHGLTDWEGWFSPYDGHAHQAVLDQILPDDVVLDIGAGDLRLALRLAQQSRRVYAVEVNPVLVADALTVVGLDLPRNLHVICANARDVPVPPGVSVAVLLMRHCRHFRTYVDRLRAAQCQRLVTNARWRTEVETIDLTTPGVAYDELEEGWYACRCGATGYVGVGARPDATPVELEACPACSAGAGGNRTQPKEEHVR